jgi:hypothetical protein
MYGHEDESNGRKGAKGANHMSEWDVTSVRIQMFETIFGAAGAQRKQKA